MFRMKGCTPAKLYNGSAKIALHPAQTASTNHKRLNLPVVLVGETVDVASVVVGVALVVSGTLVVVAASVVGSSVVVGRVVPGIPVQPASPG